MDTVFWEKSFEEKLSAGLIFSPFFNTDLLPSRVRDKDDVNLYRPSVRSEDDLYLKDTTLTPGAVGGGLAVPPGAYPNSENTRYDGHYVLDNDLPPRPGRDGEGGMG